MRTRFQRWTLHLAAVALGAAAAHAGPFLHAPTGVAFPDRLAGMEREAPVELELRQPGGGVAVSYRAPGIRATVYLYTAGHRDIPDDLKSPVLLDQLQATAEAVVRFGQLNGYAQIKQPPPRTVPWGDGEPVRQSLRITFNYEFEGAERISHLHLAGFRGHFLKVRVTLAPANLDALEAVHERALAELAALLRAAERE